MTDFDRPVHDPTTDTTSTEVPATRIATSPLATPGHPAAAAPRRSRARWLAAAGNVGLIGALTAIATLSLTGSSPASTVVGYVPADSIAYGELRLDLPGDQRQESGVLLSQCPGLADQAAVEAKVRTGGGGMTAFDGQLTDDDIANVAAYVSSVAGQ